MSHLQIHVMSLSSFQFPENRFVNNVLYLGWGDKLNVGLFSIFLSDFDKIRCVMSTTRYWEVRGVVSVGPVKIILYLLSILTFHTYCPSWVKFITRALHVILLR